MKPQLLFVSSRFLFPADSGGKIRTTQVLRGLKGGAFSITLASPAPPRAARRYASDIESVCDRFAEWPEPERGPLFPLWRLRHVVHRLPIPVATDRSAAGSAVVARELTGGPDLVVVDFPHSTVLTPSRLGPPSVLFTHNVESWIFRRHCEVTRNPLLRVLWRDQWRKMERFENDALRRFDTVVAVSVGDARWFEDQVGIGTARVIPTGVDLDYFAFREPAASERVAFTGSMDWIANQDGIAWFLDEIWPGIAAARPGASMCVVGRCPPRALTSRAAGLPWTFTGFVDDVRPFVREAAAYVIPLRVGGGTRIKAYEAMAMGCPVVSTTVGVEGLPVEPGEHFLRADGAAEFAAHTLRLLADGALRQRLARDARALVERSFSSSRAAAAFERICLETLETHAARSPRRARS